MNSRFTVLLVMLLVLLGMSIAPVSAQAPSIKVSPVWRPAVQLTTIDLGTSGVTDVGDDLRYVVVDIYATVNVEFWGIGFTCTVNKNALEQYTAIDPGSTEDDTPMLTSGADWTNPTVANLASGNTTDIDGKFNFAIAETGAATPPIGSNGVTETLHIASLKYRVKEGLTAATTSTFTCVTSFLNRDGKAVLTAMFVAPPALSIIPGYQLSGKVTYQGISTVPTAAQAITVSCDDDSNGVFDDVVATVNPTTGMFSVPNLRQQGRYECWFVANMRTPLGAVPDLHLRGYTDFYLSTTSLTLLPFMLLNGNTNDANGIIDNADLFAVTGNWNVPQAQPYDSGDASGDKKINEADLVQVLGNYNTFLSEPAPAHHLIYSLPRSSNVFQNSRLWLGGRNSASVTQFVPGTSRDYWPAVSPDGKKIAFVRNVGTGTTNKFALFTAPITNGVVGTATRITPTTATYDAFAPSWSPDGSQIGFVCSYSAQWFSASNPMGNLCLMDAGGLNFRLPLEVTSNRPLPVKIQPPAWVNAQLLAFAYAPETTANTCDNRVCYVNLTTYTLTTSPFILTGTDMPVVRNGALGLTLFYRFDDGVGNIHVRGANINETTGFPNSIFGVSSTPPNMHMQIPNVDSPVGYFTVSTGADPDIFYYNSSAVDAGGRTFYVRFLTNPVTPNWTWGDTFQYTVSDVVGNPDFASSYYAALLNTVAFVP